MQNEFDKKILRMEQELRDLKTVQGGIKNVECFVKTFTSSGPLNGSMFKVTYADGSAPIISVAYYYPMPIALRINGNEQNFYMFRNYGTPVTIVSTREIVSVVDNN